MDQNAMETVDHLLKKSITNKTQIRKQIEFKFNATIKVN